MVKAYIPERGDITWLDFDPQKGREQMGKRPALVISPKVYNKNGLAIFCPITSQIKGYPFELQINAGKISGAVLIDHIKNLDWKARKAKFITKLNKTSLERVQKVLIALMLNN